MCLLWIDSASEQIGQSLFLTGRGLHPPPNFSLPGIQHPRILSVGSYERSSPLLHISWIKRKIDCVGALQNVNFESFESISICWGESEVLK